MSVSKFVTSVGVTEACSWFASPVGVVASDTTVFKEFPRTSVVFSCNQYVSSRSLTKFMGLKRYCPLITLLCFCYKDATKPKLLK